MRPDWRQGILYLTFLGTEGCWLYGLVVLLNSQVADGGLATFWLLFLYPASFAFNGLLRRLRWPEYFLRVISGLAWVAAMLLLVKAQLFSDLALADATWLLAVPRALGEVLYTFRPELLVLAITGLLWWLGRRVAYLRPDFPALVTRFQFGLVMLVFIFLINSLLKLELTESVTVTLVFFLFALAGISIAHALENASWLSGLYQGHWAGLLLASIGVILLLGLLIGSLITPDLLQLVVSALKWLWGLAVKAIAFLISLLPRPESAELPLPVPPPPPVEPSEGPTLWRMPELLRRGLISGWNILWIGLILLALWRISSSILGWLRRRLSGMSGAEFEPMPGAFRTDLRDWFKRLVLRLLGIRLPRMGRQPAPSTPEAASVRELYRRFLSWAAGGGYPRHMSQTPDEYLYVLSELLPEARQDLAFMTQQYVSARYGDQPHTVDELRQLKQSWQRVKQNNLKQISGEHARGQEAR